MTSLISNLNDTGGNMNINKLLLCVMVMAMSFVAQHDAQATDPLQQQVKPIFTKVEAAATEEMEEDVPNPFALKEETVAVTKSPEEVLKEIQEQEEKNWAAYYDKKLEALQGEECAEQRVIVEKEKAHYTEPQIKLLRNAYQEFCLKMDPDMLMVFENAFADSGMTNLSDIIYPPNNTAIKMLFFINKTTGLANRVVDTVFFPSVLGNNPVLAEVNNLNEKTCHGIDADALQRWQPLYIRASCKLFEKIAPIMNNIRQNNAAFVSSVSFLELTATIMTKIEGESKKFAQEIPDATMKLWQKLYIESSVPVVNNLAVLMRRLVAQAQQEAQEKAQKQKEEEGIDKVD